MLSAIFLCSYLWQGFLETHSFQIATNVFVCYGPRVTAVALEERHLIDSDLNISIFSHKQALYISLQMPCISKFCLDWRASFLMCFDSTGKTVD